MLGHEGTIEAGGWRALRPVPGAPINQPEPLFKKLEPLEVESSRSA
jgi:hypothetical protein